MMVVVGGGERRVNFELTLFLGGVDQDIMFAALKEHITLSFRALHTIIATIFYKEVPVSPQSGNLHLVPHPLCVAHAHFVSKCKVWRMRTRSYAGITSTWQSALGAPPTLCGACALCVKCGKCGIDPLPELACYL